MRGCVDSERSQEVWYRMWYGLKCLLHNCPFFVLLNIRWQQYVFCGLEGRSLCPASARESCGLEQVQFARGSWSYYQGLCVMKAPVVHQWSFFMSDWCIEFIFVLGLLLVSTCAVRKRILPEGDFICDIFVFFKERCPRFSVCIVCVLHVEEIGLHLCIWCVLGVRNEVGLSEISRVVRNICLKTHMKWRVGRWT